MIKLSFNTLAIAGFKSFAQQSTLDLQDRGSGLHFMRGRNKRSPRLGSNGSGKSTVWDAMTWCLYGRTPGDLRNPDVQPWSGEKLTEVSLGVSINDEQHIVVRTAHPNATRIDGKVCGSESIEQLIGMSYQTFINTVIMGQGRPLFFDLDPRNKMQLFSDVLNLERWDARAIIAGAAERKLSDELHEWQGQHTAAQSQLTQAESLLGEARMASDTWNNERETRRGALEKTLAGLDRTLAKALVTRGDADLALERDEIAIRGQEKIIATATENLRKATLACDREQLVIDAATANIKKLDADLAELKRAKVCPTCGQPVKAKDLGKHSNEIRVEREAEQTVIDAGLPAKLVDAERAAKTAHKTAQAHLSVLQAQSNASRDKLDALDKQLVQLNTDRSITVKQLDAWDDEVNPFADQVTKMRKLVKQMTTQIADLDKKIDMRNRRIERTKFWVKGFKDVRLLVIDEVLQELELTTNTMLPGFGLDGWEVKYETQRETKAGTSQHRLNVSILSPDNKTPVKWEAWSGGEGQRLRVVGALALSEVLLAHAGLSCDLEVLDEPTQHLSVEGVRDLCNQLAERAQDLHKQTWLIDHMAMETSLFSSVATVTKTSKGSMIT